MPGRADAQPLFDRRIVLYTTYVNQAEILYGIGALPEGRRRTALAAAAEAMFAEDFAGRILSFEARAAARYPGIVLARRYARNPIEKFDALIAATALAAGASIAARNAITFELSTSSAFNSSGVNVTNWPRPYSYPFTTSRLSISSPVPGSCGRSAIRVAARLWSASGLPFSAGSRGADDAEPCCAALRSGNSSSFTSTGAGCHTWCKRIGFVCVVAGDK